MDCFRVTLACMAICLAAPAAAQTACRFEAYTIADPAVEVQIMDAPSAEANVLAIAPLSAPEGEDWIFGAEFTVTGMQDGWAQVTNVTDWDRGVTAPDGWISGDLIRFVAQTEIVFSGPGAESAVIWESSNIWPTASAVHDCAGEWALISFRDDHPQTVKGWVRGICGIQETTCDGTEGDRLR